MFGLKKEEQRDSTQSPVRNKRNEVRRCTTIDGPPRFTRNPSRKIYCCRELNRKFTIHQQLFNTLDSMGTPNYSEVLHAQSILLVARHHGVARLCGAGVCRV